MADFNYGSYKYSTLTMQRSKENTTIDITDDVMIEIGLKGTKANGLVQKRMEEMKK